ncbi:MAG TPA: hypothetical protein VFU06_03195 [Longimicrobiales bacterium]|nr:hypothetical protein [Longimicrobiales bacterium]
MRTRRYLTLVSGAVALSALACAQDTETAEETRTPPAAEAPSDAAVRVTDVEMGRSIGSDGRIADDADTDDFTPRDTIYVSVHTEGSASGGRLTARWTFEDGQVVDETSQTLSSTGPSVTEFHISRPDGFPAGSYRVEIQLDGRTVETEDFTVR